MHRIVRVFALAAFLALALSSPWVAAEDKGGNLCFPVKTLSLTPPEGVEAKRPPAVFSHAEHAFRHPCAACHHAWEIGEEIQNCSTSGCHDQGSPPEKPARRSWKDLEYSGENIVYFKFAYHRLCIGCHRETKVTLKDDSQGGTESEEGTADSLPTGCVDCHLPE